jgi:hypothetical protein
MGNAHRSNTAIVVQALKGRNTSAMGNAHRSNTAIVVQALKGRNI